MIVCDTDFLSSFGKINKLDLIFKVFKTKEMVIAQAVYDELKESPMFDLLLPYFSANKNKIIVKKVPTKNFPHNLGGGERESIAFAKDNKAKLLMNDKVAGKYAKTIGVKVIDIPAFLLYCKEKKILGASQLKIIILKLKAKDFYEFEKEVKKALASNN